jgi:hypothetical protein
MGLPAYANRIIESASGPVLSPGGSGDLNIVVRNPNAAAPMTNIVLKASIYLYRSLEEERDVASMSSPPVFANTYPGTTEHTIPSFELAPNATASFALLVDTSRRTPSPGLFDQGAYFVRLWMSFDCTNASYTLFSRGHFTDEQWSGYLAQANVSQDAGRAYLEGIGCDGILPDTSFTVRETVPLWPLAILVLATCGTAFLALMYYLEENPGKAPKLEKGFQRARGKAKQAWALCKQPFRKP